MMTGHAAGEHKILIIDDSRTVLAVTGAILRNAGYQVVTVDKVLGVSALIVREKPDLILMDLAMPMRGSHLVQVLRKHHMLDSARVVMHSSRPPDEVEQATRECGADGYIQKTADSEKFLSQIVAYLTPRESPAGA